MFTNLRTKLRVFASLGFALALGFTASTALAQSQITMDDAERIAREHVPNATVESIERDHEGESVVYEVELRTDQGVEHEIVIDAADGHVISAEIDD